MNKEIKSTLSKLQMFKPILLSKRNVIEKNSLSILLFQLFFSYFAKIIILIKVNSLSFAFYLCLSLSRSIYLSVSKLKILLAQINSACCFQLDSHIENMIERKRSLISLYLYDFLNFFYFILLTCHFCFCFIVVSLSLADMLLQ